MMMPEDGAGMVPPGFNPLDERHITATAADNVFYDEVFPTEIAPHLDAAYVAAGALLSARPTWTITHNGNPGSGEYTDVSSGLLAVGDTPLAAQPNDRFEFTGVSLSYVAASTRYTKADKVLDYLLPTTGNSDHRPVPKEWLPVLGDGGSIAVRAYTVTNLPPKGELNQWQQYSERAGDSRPLLRHIRPDLGIIAELAALVLPRETKCYVKPLNMFNVNGYSHNKLVLQRSDIRPQPGIATYLLPEDPAAATAEFWRQVEARKTEVQANARTMEDLLAARVVPVRTLLGNKAVRKWWNEHTEYAEKGLRPTPGAIITREEKIMYEYIWRYWTTGKS